MESRVLETLGVAIMSVCENKRHMNKYDTFDIFPSFSPIMCQSVFGGMGFLANLPTYRIVQFPESTMAPCHDVLLSVWE